VNKRKKEKDQDQGFFVQLKKGVKQNAGIPKKITEIYENGQK